MQTLLKASLIGLAVASSSAAAWYAAPVGVPGGWYGPAPLGVPPMHPYAHAEHARAIEAAIDAQMRQAEAHADQLSRFQHPGLPGFPGAETWPALPEFGAYPAFPERPALPAWGEYPAPPAWPDLPQWPAAGDYPAWPELPALPPRFGSHGASPDLPPMPSFGDYRAMPGSLAERSAAQRAQSSEEWRARRAEIEAQRAQAREQMDAYRAALRSQLQGRYGSAAPPPPAAAQ